MLESGLDDDQQQSHEQPRCVGPQERSKRERPTVPCAVRERDVWFGMVGFPSKNLIDLL